MTSIGSEQLVRFERDGFVIVPRMVAPARLAEINRVALRELTHNIGPAEYEADLRYPGAPTDRRRPGGDTTRRLLQAYSRDDVFREWALDPAVNALVSTLLGSPVMLSQVHHNCIMTKQPRYSSTTGWHQDIRYWSFERPQLISAWLALGHEFPDNGCLSFLPGTHVLELENERLDASRFLREDLPANQALIATRVTPPLEPGDVVLFHCRTFHAAGNNRTDHAKLSLVFTYHHADNQPIAGTRSASSPSIPL